MFLVTLDRDRISCRWLDHLCGVHTLLVTGQAQIQKSRKMAEKSNWKFPKKMPINLILSFQISKFPLKIPMYFLFFFQKELLNLHILRDSEMCGSPFKLIQSVHLFTRQQKWFVSFVALHISFSFKQTMTTKNVDIFVLKQWKKNQVNMFLCCR